ncbi:tRNA (cytosine(32)/uridine(32)-2'-O)-methyltransferase TrmJ, partial [Salmonella enterica subsp. enterica serovar Infantis]
SLLSTGFILENHTCQVMNKLRRLFNRALPERHELNILRGILSSIEQQNKGK